MGESAVRPPAGSRTTPEDVVTAGDGDGPALRPRLAAWSGGERAGRAPLPSP